MRPSSFVASFSIVALASLVACGGEDDDALFGAAGPEAAGSAGTSGATKGGSGGTNDAGGASASAGTGGTGGKGGTTGKGGTGGKSGKAGAAGDVGEGGEGGEAGSDAGGAAGTSAQGGASGKGGSAGKAGSAGASGGTGKGGSAGVGGGANAGSGGSADAGSAGTAGASSGGAAGNTAGSAGSTSGGSAGSEAGGAAGACQTPPTTYFAKPFQTNLQLIVDNSGSMQTNVCAKACGTACCTGESRSVLAQAVLASKAFLDVAPADPSLAVGLSRLPGNASSCPPPAAPLVSLGLLPANEPPLVTALDAFTAQGASATSPGIEGASKYVATALAARPAEGRALIFLTDGTPGNCGPDDDEAGTKAAAASFARGVPVHVFAIVPNAGLSGNPNANDVAGMNALAKAGGTTQAAVIAERKDIQGTLAAAFERVRRATFSCRFDLAPASGSFDASVDSVALVTDGGELPLQLAAGAEACSGTGYYVDGNTAVLCPPLCAIAREQTNPRLLVTADACSP